MHSRLPLAGQPATSALLRTYIEDFGKLAQFYDYNPHAAAAVEARLMELDSRAWPDLAQSAQLAAAQQEAWGADQLAIDNAWALGQPQTCMVVSGQQAGLFGGPLYTQLKALSTVLHARQLAAAYPGRRFVPLFWIASGDSDFEEVRRTTLWTGGQGLSELALRSEPALDGMTLARRPLAHAALEEAWSTLAGSCGQGLYREDTLAALRAAYLVPDEPDAGRLVRGFARWMSRLFSGTGLVVLEPEKMLAQRTDIGELYARHLRLTGATEQALQARDAALREAGYRPQAELAEGDSQLFMLDEQGYRDKLMLGPDGASCTGKRSGGSWSIEELAGMAQAEPGRFSGSVLLRPVVEDALFPCAAWIGGAAELAYRAQSTALFTLHGRKHAPAYLRQHATLMSRRTAEALEQAGLGLDSLPRDPEAWRRELAGRVTAPGLAELLAEYRRAAQAADAAAERLPEQLPQLERSLRTMRGKLQWQLERVERKIRAALLREGERQTAELLEAQALAFPRAVPQERVLNLLSFLPRAGFGLLSHLLEELQPSSWEHCLIMFD